MIVRIMLCAVLSISLAGIPSAAEAKVSKPKISRQVAELGSQLEALRVRYQRLADQYTERAETADEPAPYTNVAQRFTVFAARATTLKAELESVRTASALSTVRQRKVRLHQSAAKALRDMLKVTRQEPVTSATP